MDLRSPTFISFPQLQQPVHRKRSQAKRRAPEEQFEEEEEEESAYKQPELVRLCREHEWDAVLQRCASHPDEAIPQCINPKQEAVKRDRLAFGARAVVSTELSHCSALGIVCAHEFDDKGLMVALVGALVRASPAQICSSQAVKGHTPLRDACRNSALDCEVLKIMLSHDEGIKAASLRDEHCLAPMDHLIIRMTLHDADEARKRFFKYIDLVPRQCLHGPISRLLSLSSGSDCNPQQLQKITSITRYLLDKCPDFLFERSITSACTTLHIALRAFGNNEDLIRMLLERDTEGTLLACRNVFGDLPVHIACSVGVPVPVLQLVLQATPSSIVFSKNKAGYTPVDLEWMRHIEGGFGLCEQRPFYPLEERGIRCSSPRHEELYRQLLCKAVKQVTEQKDMVATEVFGTVLDRIILVVQSACAVHEKSTLLHSVCKLVSATGPCLPEPLVRLFLQLHAKQVERLDEHRRLPLHYALMRYRESSDDCGATGGRPNEYSNIVLNILDAFPNAARVSDADSRLPLHYALQNHSNERVIQALVNENPDSVERRDPVTGLYPFMLASGNILPCYELLRRAPTLVNYS